MDVREVQSDTLGVQGFRRSLSGLGVVILTLSVLSPGVSILVSGASILQQSGSGAVIAFAVGTLVCFCQTALIAELGAAYPSAGYDYAAIGHAIGDWAGATCYFTAIPLVPLFLNLAASGIAIYLQPLGLPFDVNTTTLITTAVVTALAMLNIRANEYLTGVFLLIEVAALALVAAVGLYHIQPDAAARVLQPMHLSAGLWVAAGIGVVGIGINSASWALAGASQALLFSEDMKRPQTIGRVIMIAFALTALLEIAPVLGTIIGAHDLKAVLANDAPFHAFLAEYLPNFVLKLVSISIAVAIFNACLAGFVGWGRGLFSMGRTALFAPPINRALMRLTPRSEAPWVALLLLGATSALATYLPLSAKVLLLAGNNTLLTGFYVAGVLIGRRNGRTGRDSYRTPLFPLFPILGIAIIVGEVAVLWIDAETGRKSLFVCAAVYLLGYLYYRFVLKRRPGGWSLTGPADIDRRVAAGSVQPGA